MPNSAYGVVSANYSECCTKVGERRVYRVTYGCAHVVELEEVAAVESGEGFAPDLLANFVEVAESLVGRAEMDGQGVLEGNGRFLEQKQSVNAIAKFGRQVEEA